MAERGDFTRFNNTIHFRDDFTRSNAFVCIFFFFLL